MNLTEQEQMMEAFAKALDANDLEALRNAVLYWSAYWHMGREMESIGT